MKKIVSTLIAGLFVASAAWATPPVNLELRAPDAASVGETLEVQIVATAQDEAFCMATVALAWDAASLRLTGSAGSVGWPPDGTTGGDWMFQGFPDDSGLGGVNVSLDDGDAYYQAWANMSEFPVATPGGLVIDTLKFDVLTSGPARIEVVREMNDYTKTAIYDAEVGGWDIAYEIEGCTVTLSEPQSDLSELAALLAVYGTANDEYDKDGDGMIGPTELAILLANYGE